VRPGYERDVGSGPLDVRLAERDVVRLLGHVALGHVEELVLDADDRVVITDGGLQEALRVPRRGGHHDFQAGDVVEERLEALGVLAGQ
jgi:hypothetical protein